MKLANAGITESLKTILVNAGGNTCIFLLLNGKKRQSHIHVELLQHAGLSYTFININVNCK